MLDEGVWTWADDCDDGNDGDVLWELSFDSIFMILDLSKVSVKTAWFTLFLLSSVGNEAVTCALVETSVDSSSWSWLSLSVPISSITILLRGFWNKKKSNGKITKIIYKEIKYRAEYPPMLTLDFTDDFLLASSLCNGFSVSAGLSLSIKIWKKKKIFRQSISPECK